VRNTGINKFYAGNPVNKDDPYACQWPALDDCGFLCRMEAGVVHVYRDDDSLERDEPIHTVYPPLNEFLADQAVLTGLISDGPLCVCHHPSQRLPPSLSV